MDDYKKYLPSKNFTSLILVLVVIVLLFLSGKEVISLIKNRERKDSMKDPEVVTIKDIIEEDQNNNGIPDWEEVFWGLDPKEDGEKNKEFILEKRRLANQVVLEEYGEEPIVLTENEIMSRDFFIAILALSEAGELNEDSISVIAETLGEKVIATPIDDVYFESDLIIDYDPTVESVFEYVEKITSLFEKYYEEKDLGEEIKLVAIGIGEQDQVAMRAVKSIAEGYHLLGKELIKIPVAEDLSFIHLEIANNCEKIAISIEGMTSSIDDPGLGLKSLINYQKYSDALIENLEEE